MIYFEQGTEHWLPEAKRFLERLEKIRARTGAQSISRAMVPEDGVLIWAKVSPLRKDIRITGGSGTLWVPHRPEQNLWSIPSAVLPSMGSVIPWTAVIQRVAYPYYTSDPLSYTVKHQLVICRYCRRVAEYEWTETRSVESVAGEQMLGGTIDLSYDPHDLIVPEDTGSPYDGLSLDGNTWYYDGDLYSPDDLVEYEGQVVTFTPDPGDFLFSADGVDYYGGVITYGAYTVTLEVPINTDPVEDGFSLDGTTWGYGTYYGGDQFTEAEFAADNGAATATFNATGPQYEVGAVTSQVYTGAYVSHDNTNVTTRAVDVYGNITDTVTPHGLIAASAANPWGYLTDDLGPRNWSASQSYVAPLYTYSVYRGATPVSSVFVEATTTGEIIQPDGTYGPPNGFPDIQIITTGYYEGASPGYWVPPGEYHKYNGVDEYNDALQPNPSPPYAAAIAEAAAYNAAWDEANYQRWKEIVDFICSEMDAKRFGVDMDLDELCPPNTYPPHKSLRIFPVVSSVTFTWSDAYGNSGEYEYSSSYTQYANLTPLLGISLTDPAAGEWAYTVQNPYKLTWDGVSAFELLPARTPSDPPFDYMGAGKTPLFGSGRYEYFGLYKDAPNIAVSFSLMTAAVS